MELAHGDATTCTQVDLVAVLDKPAGCRQVDIDFAAGLLLRGFGTEGVEESIRSLLERESQTEPDLPLVEIASQILR